MLDSNIDAELNIAKFVTEYKKASIAKRIYLEDAVRLNIAKYLAEGEISQQQHDEAQSGINEIIRNALAEGLQ